MNRSLLAPLVGAVLMAVTPCAFAVQGSPIPPPPGNYSNRQLNPSTTPSDPFGYDLVLEENVPGVTYQALNTVPPGGTPLKYPAASVTVTLIISESSATYLDQYKNSILSSPLATFPVAPNVTGPTGTFASGTAGEQFHNVLSNKTGIEAYDKPGIGNIGYYQFEYSVTYSYSPSNQVPLTVASNTQAVYGPVCMYSF